MCGICGLAGQANEQLIQAMLGRIAHRGPDDHGVYLTEMADGGRVALGHRRLSIIDLSAAGHEPMSDREGRVWLTYNGEIYNFREIRRELEQLGHRFRSETDAEVVIYAYIEWGAACLLRFNGMFAFAIWDTRDDSLFLARDHVGIKPLYYTTTPEGFAFSSEIKAFLELPGFDPELDLEALDQFLTFLWVPDPKTAFKGVMKLPPGHYLIFKNRELAVREYWDVKFDEDDSLSETDWTERVREQIARSVRAQLMADVPLGAFLSGGVDSSSIVALMSAAAHGSDQVTTYTFGFKSDDLRYDVIEDDVKYAREVGRQFGTDYNESFLEPQVMDLLPKLVYHLDEPVADPAVITSYLICKSARERLTVLLSGMGGDEVFAGYPRHLAVRIAGAYNLIPSFLSRPVVESLPGSRPGRFNALFRNTKKLARSAALPERERYLGFGTYFTTEEKQSLFTHDIAAAADEFDAYSAHRACFERVAGEDFINQMLYVDLKTFLPCLNLTYTDKTSMASSVEVRVPLLDHELIELAARIPAGLKIKGLTRKYILKRAAEAWLPDHIIKRRKSGFSAPVRAWLVRDLREMVEDVLSKTAIERRGYFNYAAVRKLIDDNLSGREDNALKVFQLLTLELWHRAFLDR
ncbi:MAG TPA: asparagine synthase (glutamine-hydrolyzing) [Blastocatellia bacterium]|nr:asparagine synthase (glutamine-hydrolyzing) [Blastocatellia bacterium]